MPLYCICLLWTTLLTTNLLFPQLALAEIKHDILPLAQVQSVSKSISPKQAIARLFTSEQIQTEWFASEFLTQIPIERIRQVVNSLKSQLGNYVEVENNGQDYLVVFSQASVPTKIVLNNKGQIAGLLFQPPQAKVIDLKAAIAGFQALPGNVSFLVQEGTAVKAALNTQTPLAVGSAFKLAVLKALQSEINSGKRMWQDVVQLEPSQKSLPSGMLQTWPDGAYLTVQTLAALMISLSDNTATDILINLLGREPIEVISPRNRPFLTTRELFILKGSRNRKLLKRYQTSNEAQRRTILKELIKKPLPDVREFEGTNPVALDVEWFFTAEELCGLMKEVADLPLMSINPGVANPNDWRRVAFKGGSEPGVLNLTTWLEAKNGKNYCVAATWNNSNAPVEESKFMALYSGVITNLASKVEARD
ncbi:serine hydrolase [Nostoc sp. FACHB-152]|uniref:serine hydrolase n=1 Tax=unclassified Nostoc TaxID=2593658 RepID=UPI0016862C56|nr:MULTISPECIES: serine hydrolase [unclassified Nostoc]MBD2448534.1 serine hydrolase [Nostoc sp. FACHB-152]MBD2466271.1 serine hydrolase [Nostoc sp. FACHB-145]